MSMTLTNLLSASSQTTADLEDRKMLAITADLQLGTSGDLADYDGKAFLDVKYLLQSSTESTDVVEEAVYDHIDKFTSTSGRKADGIRVPIFFDGQEDLFKAGDLRFDAVSRIVEYASDKGLEVYANPAGSSGMIPDEYYDASKYAERINEFAEDHPEVDYIGPFNEPTLHFTTDWMDDVLDDLDVDTQTVGPDLLSLNATSGLINRLPELLNRFDVIASHNLAINGSSGDADDWEALKSFAEENDKEIWDSEAVNSGTDKQRIDVAAEADLDAIVLYTASTDSTDYSW